MNTKLNKKDIKDIIYFLKTSYKSENIESYKNSEDGDSFWGWSLLVSNAKDHNKEIKRLIKKLKALHEKS